MTPPRPAAPSGLLLFSAPAGIDLLLVCARELATEKAVKVILRFPRDLVIENLENLPVLCLLLARQDRIDQ